MTRVKRFILATFLLVSSTALAQGVYEAWVARYNGPGNGADGAAGLVVDSAGNAYVTGWSRDATSLDYATVKYAPNGDTFWVRRYNGPANSDDEASAVAVDAAGNIYVTGWSWSATSQDCATIKYAPNGDTLWVRRYNGPGNSYDDPEALALDDSGNVYVTGSSVGSGTSEDYTTIKYAPQGDTLWVRRYDGPGNSYDYANALALNDSGNVYVTGASTGSGTDYDYATVKYAPNGDTLWVRRYNGPGNFYDDAEALALDDSGNVYVTGRSRSGTSEDYTTIKYAPNGDSLWVRRYNGPGDASDRATALALDDSGNVYVTGSSSGGGIDYDYATIKYAPNGDTLWVRRYNGPGNSYDDAEALALDDSGNVYVTGTSVGSGTSEDYATVKYAPNGDTSWVRRYNGPSNDFDDAFALALDDSGNVYVTGYSIGSDSITEDYATVKYSPCSAIPGDVNATGDITIGDILHVVNYIFDKDKFPCLGSEPGNCWTPGPFCRGDVNQTGTITIGDIVHLVNYIFDKDRLPCLGSEPGNCWTPETSGACCLSVP